MEELLGLATAEEIKQAARLVKQRTPSLYFVPNVGQEKFFKPYKSGKAPYINLFGGGNGVGKTSAEMVHMVGMIWGQDYLNEFFDDYEFYILHNRMKEERGRRGMYRIICQADHIKVGGPVHQNILEWFPKGKYKMDKGGKSFYQQIMCDNGDFIDIKTWDQDVLALAGPTLDFILTDEPMPENLWDETIGRTRAGGKIAMGMTPLEMAGWVMDKIVDDADGSRIVMSNGSVWDNCKNWHPDDVMWSGGKVGVGDVLTRGHLEKEDVDNMIREWEKSNSLTVDARVNGTFTHLSGSIYKVYSDSTHLVTKFPVEPEWPVYCVMDPHDSKPPAIIWAFQTPTGFYGFREWPTEDYVSLDRMNLTVAEVAEIMREIEAPFRSQVVYRYMDPNYGVQMSHQRQTTIQMEYAKHGFRFDCAIMDDLQVGHEKLNQMLWYDWRRPIEEESNRPLLRFFDDMNNSRKALKRYGLKRNSNPGQSLTSKIEQKYKDFADTWRYLSVKRKAYMPVTDMNTYVQRAYSGRVEKDR